MRHKLVQRIVAAYNEYAEKQAPALRAAAAAAAGLIEIDLIEAPEELRAPRSPRSRRPGWRTATWRSSSSDAGAHPRAQPRAPRARPAHRRAVVPGRRAGPGRRAARARRRGDLPRAHRGPDRGRGARRAPPVRLRPRDATAARCSRCRRGCWRSCDALGLRGPRRPPQRGQVHARQPHRGRQGGDRVRQAADHAARDPRHRHRAGLAARAGRPARRAAPARPAHRAHAAARGARARRLRRRAVRAQRRAADRRRRPLHRRRDRPTSGCRR